MAAYPLWLGLRLKAGWLAHALVLAGGPAAFVWAGDGFLAGVIGHYQLWIAGAGLAELATSARLPRGSSLPGFLSVAAGLAVLTGMHVRWAPVAGNLLLGVGAVVGFAGSRTPFSNTAFVRLLEQLGIRSYTIYICHFPLLALASAWIITTAGNRPPSGWLALLGGGVVLAGAAALFDVCERHFLHPRLRLEPAPVLSPTGRSQ